MGMSVKDVVGKAFDGVSPILLGMGAIVVAPAVFTGARPLAKTLVKGGIFVGDKARRFFAEATEQFGDVVAEARHELHEEESEEERKSRAGEAEEAPAEEQR